MFKWTKSAVDFLALQQRMPENDKVEKFLYFHFHSGENSNKIERKQKGNSWNVDRMIKYNNNKVLKGKRGCETFSWKGHEQSVIKYRFLFVARSCSVEESFYSLHVFELSDRQISEVLPIYTHISKTVHCRNHNHNGFLTNLR